MPLFFYKQINENTKLAIWKIEEEEYFFNNMVSIQSEITHPQKRLQHFAGRYLLKYLFPDFPISDIIISETRKPILPVKQFQFSISHCQNFAAAIVSKSNSVGIDIEHADKRVLKIVPKFLSAAEIELFCLQIENLNNYSPIQLQNATLLWSIKESLFKWYGLGNVDFKTMLQICNTPTENENSLKVQINLPSNTIPLTAQFAYFNDLCLSFVIN